MITLAQLSEIERSCDSVTPGPWEFNKRGGEIEAANPHSARSPWAVGMIYHVGDGPHIARLDPATVRELVRLAKIGLEADTGANRFSEFHGDSQLLWR